MQLITALGYLATTTESRKIVLISTQLTLISRKETHFFAILSLLKQCCPVVRLFPLQLYTIILKHNPESLI